MSSSAGASQQSQLDIMRIQNPVGPDQVVEAMRAAQRRRTWRFRLTFVATWVIVVGGILLALDAGPRFDPSFLLGPVDKRVPGSTPVWVFGFNKSYPRSLKVSPPKPASSGGGV